MTITRADIRGIVGIVPTPATSDADDWRCLNSVNVAETEKMVEQVVEAGIELVMSTGTFGECASLTHQEWLQFSSCVAETIRGRVPFFAGVTTLNTRDTIARGREAIDVGADGLFVGRPMWLPLDDAGIVRFYRDITEALPGIPVVIYDNPAAFKGKISVEAYRQLADAPEIVATKHAGGPTLEGRHRGLRRQGCRAAPRQRLGPRCQALSRQGHGLLVGERGLCTVPVGCAVARRAVRGLGTGGSHFRAGELGVGPAVRR